MLNPQELAGLPLEEALRLLSAAGISSPAVTFTAAPLRPGREADPRRSEAGEASGDASTRVVAVRGEGRELVVSRFLISDPV